MSPFGLKFSQMILHTETSKLMYNWSFLFEVLHKPTLLPSTFNFNESWLYTTLSVKRNITSSEQHLIKSEMLKWLIIEHR